MVNNTALDRLANMSFKMKRDLHPNTNIDGPFEWNKENQGT
jgi:hypothetical protein